MKHYILNKMSVSKQKRVTREIPSNTWVENRQDSGKKYDLIFTLTSDYFEFKYNLNL